MKKLFVLLFLCCTSAFAQGPQGLLYGTYFGGSNIDKAHGLVADSLGDMFLTGLASSTNFPVLNPVQAHLAGAANAFVAKFNSNGTLAWSTYLGGSGSDQGSGIATDKFHNLYVVGTTSSDDFPVTRGVLQSKLTGATDAFVAKFSPLGKLIWSTYVAGTGIDTEGNSVAIDTAGNIWIGGDTGGATGKHGYVAEINPTATRLLFSTTIGGSGTDSIRSIALLNEEAYVAGYTNSTDFPTTPGVIQKTCGPSCSSWYSGFVAELGENGVAYATYLGGNTSPSPATPLNLAIGIAVDASGNAYITGTTDTTDFPVTKGAFQTVYGGTTDLNGGKGAGCIDFINAQLPCGDAYVVKLNPTGTAIDWATYIGGSTADIGYSIALDSKDDIWVGGYTQSYYCPQCKPPKNGFPVTSNAFQSKKGGGLDAFLTEVSPTGSSLIYSTYYGGSNDEIAYALAVDPLGAGYIAGRTISTNTPVTSDAYQKTLLGVVNVFVAKIKP